MGADWCLGLRGVLGVCPPLGAALCRGHVWYPVFAPGTSEVTVGVLVFLYLVAHNLSHFSGMQSFLVPCSFFVGEGNGTPLQYSCLENPMDGGAWWAAVHGVAKSQTRLSDIPFTFHFHALEKEMATHSSVLAWRIPGTGEPGELPSMGSHRVGHD